MDSWRYAGRIAQTPRWACKQAGVGSGSMGNLRGDGLKVGGEDRIGQRPSAVGLGRLHGP